MFSLIRKTVISAALVTVASWASAASYTYEFTTFFDPSTPSTTDTAAWGSSVASLRLDDVDGGVQFTLSNTAFDFPAKSEAAGVMLRTLWLSGTWGGLVGEGVSGGASAQPIYQDGDFEFNGQIKLNGAGLAEGGTAVFTVMGEAVSAASFFDAGVPMLQFSGVGAPYATLLSSRVNFVGTGSLVTPPVPEPSTVALLLAGLGGVGLVARRRRTA